MIRTRPSSFTVWRSYTEKVKSLESSRITSRNGGKEKGRICVTKDITRIDERDNPKLPLNHAGFPTISQAQKETLGESPLMLQQRNTQSTLTAAEKPSCAQLRCFCHPQSITKMLQGNCAGYREQATAVSISRMGWCLSNSATHLAVRFGHKNTSASLSDGERQLSCCIPAWGKGQAGQQKQNTSSVPISHPSPQHPHTMLQLRHLWLSFQHLQVLQKYLEPLLTSQNPLSMLSPLPRAGCIHSRCPGPAALWRTLPQQARPANMFCRFKSTLLRRRSGL